jgi:hypothetical protein
MRYFSIALFCIMFSMSGSLIAAAHTNAHAQSAEMIEMADGHNHDHDADDDGHHDSDSADHHKHTGHADHSAELHFTALGVSSMTADMHMPDAALRSTYLNLQYPAPLLPPDPDPDRA